MSLYPVPVSLREACEFVDQYHRHNKAPQGGKYAIGVTDGAGLWGVAIVGRPVARALDNGRTLEVTRTCVRPGAPKGCNSFLYGRAWHVAKNLGYERLVTYTLESESGASLRGAGWRVVAEVPPRANPWHGPDRARDWQPVYGQLKFRWEVNA